MQKFGKLLSALALVLLLMISLKATLALFLILATVAIFQGKNPVYLGLNEQFINGSHVVKYGLPFLIMVCILLLFV